MNNKLIKGGVAILVLVFIFLLVTVYMERTEQTPEQAGPVITIPVASSTDLLYVGTRFSVKYPEGYTVSTSSNNGLFDKGVSFIVPIALTQGTNLSTDSRIYIEAMAIASSTCATSSQKTVSFGENTYQTITYLEAGAGNLYETSVYSIAKGPTCYEISQFIHSGNIANYVPGAVKAFDRAVLDTGLRKVLESFKITTL